jgi:hypothetical protein
VPEPEDNPYEHILRSAEDRRRRTVQLQYELLQSNEILTDEALNILVAGVEWGSVPAEGALAALERSATASGFSYELRDKLIRWKKSLGNEDKLNDRDRDIVARIRLVLGQAVDSGLVSGEAWSNAAKEDLKRMAVEDRSHWCSLLQHCQKADTSKPTKKWMKAANELVETLGRKKFKSQLLKWFELVALPRPVHEI